MNRSLVLVCGLLVSVLWSHPVYSVTENQVLQDFELLNSQQKKSQLKKHLGKITIINLWATWCEACKTEIKEMIAAYRQQTKSSEHLQLLFVSLDKKPEQAQKWISENIEDPKAFSQRHLFFDPSFALAERLEVDAFPMTLIVDQTGKVLKIYRGFKENTDQTKRMFAFVQQKLAP